MAEGECGRHHGTVFGKATGIRDRQLERVLSSRVPVLHFILREDRHMGLRKRQRRQQDQYGSEL